MPVKRENDKIELLAPAGKMDALRAAVQNGADAVYLGIKNFSARKNAVNFSYDELREAVKYCHLRGVKVHLALNTLVDESEFEEFEDAIKHAAELGVDALIIQDYGALKIAREVCPEMELHASTQMSAANLYDVQALSKLGFKRVVLARELSMEEIKYICDNTDVEIEVFAHGALCVCVSGKCLMSSFIGMRSGNRGMCAQPCRQLYTTSGKTGYFLSPRDLCLADEIAALSKCGVASIKIEGRMKSSEYVAAVTSVYRKYLDNALPLRKEDEDYLKKIFVRGDGFTKGYFKKINTPEIMNYDKSNDKITYRADKEALLKAQGTYRAGEENKRILTDAEFFAAIGEKARLILTDADGFSAQVEGPVCEKAIKVPLSEESVRKSISKMGQTPFELRYLKCEIIGDAILSSAQLNSMRREAAIILEESRAKIRPREIYPFKYEARVEKKSGKMYIAAQINSVEQFEASKKADRVLVPLNLWGKVNVDERCALVLPQVVFDYSQVEAAIQKKLPKMVYTSSIGIGKKLSEAGIQVICDYGANVYNYLCAREMENIFNEITLSTELSLSKIQSITSKTHLPCEVLLYGRFTLMTTRACLIRGASGKCDCTKPMNFKDKTGAIFTVYGDKETHLNTLVNSRPTFMADKISLIKKSGITGIRLVFTDETSEEINEIIKMHKGEIPAQKPPFFTRGYFLK